MRNFEATASSALGGHRYPVVRFGWPVVLIGSTVAAVLLSSHSTGSTLSLAVILWFLAVCPGMAYVRLLRLADGLAECVAAVGLSVVMDSIAAGVLLYAGRWQPSLALWGLAVWTIIGALAQAAPRLSWREPPLGPNPRWANPRSILAGLKQSFPPHRQSLRASAIATSACVVALFWLLVQGGGRNPGRSELPLTAAGILEVSAQSDGAYRFNALTGGSVDNGNVRISIPPRALETASGAATIAIQQLVGDVQLPDGAPYLRRGGTAIRVVVTDSNRTLTTAAQPINLRIRYTAADLASAEGDPSSLTAAYLVQAGTPPLANPLNFPPGTWVFYPPSLVEVDNENQAVVVTTQAIPSVMAVVVRPFAQARVRASETGLYSSPKPDGRLFGMRMQGTALGVVGPLIGPRLLVLDLATNNYAYVDAADVAPDVPATQR
jgi:hypothetical protein